MIMIVLVIGYKRFLNNKKIKDSVINYLEEWILFNEFYWLLTWWTIFLVLIQRKFIIYRAE